ncbi:MAG: helix-turn-helix transcriptional regulator [Rickettsiales bacterium]|jgi:DNA-binding HxlR family transcriptional regulator|nr:helix-turn-helix transcriptional regulator [Rickettsiales bacterium]
MQCAKKHFVCPAEITVCLIGSKWRLLILKELSGGTRRFGDLLNGLAGISKKVLASNLRAMEADGLVSRRVYAEVPPRVEYSMTDTAKDLSRILDFMGDWGAKYMVSRQSMAAPEEQ